MGKHRILITGATGVTGGHAIRQLAKTNFHLRALVHRMDERSEALEKMGVEIFIGDIGNFNDVRTALTDVDRAYFVYPIRPGLVEATVQFGQAALEAGVGYIVNMSQISARPDATSKAAFAHWLSERVLDRTGIKVTHLRPTFFAEWMTRTAPMLARGNVVYLPFGGGQHAAITGTDQGGVIAALLANPEAHAGNTYTLVGAQESTPSEMVAKLGQAIGKDLTYQQIPASAFCDPIKQQIRDQNPDRSEAELATPLADINFLAQHLTEVAKDYSEGKFAGLNTSVADITGRPAQTLEMFFQENRAVFEFE